MEDKKITIIFFMNNEYGADLNTVKYASIKAVSYDNNLAHGSSNKGINKIWQDSFNDNALEISIRDAKTLEIFNQRIQSVLMPWKVT